ncbi:MAG: hypothetical protein NT169_15170 [Chloroflexi bacterium]|nr:hypothetical protein [Chloroflexota bacterium]
MNDERRTMNDEGSPRFRPPSFGFRFSSFVGGRPVTLSPIHLVLLLIFGLFVIAPLLQPGYPWGAHDARHDVYFIFQYDKSVQDGIWLPRWSPDWTFGYGYPFFIVYGPLSTFIGVLLHRFLALGYEDSVKAVLALSILFSGLAMYGFVRSWLGRNAALVAAVAYMAIPYHLVDVFVRAALAESVALVFLPLALWGFRETVVRPRLRAVLGAGAAYAAIMWTSNLVALIFTPALAAYVAVLLYWWFRDEGRKTKDERSTTVAGLPSSVIGRWSFVIRRLTPPALAFALGLGLSAAFFVPALVEMGYINRTQWFGAYYDPTQHFVYFFQLFNPAWGFGISQPGPDDATLGSMSYQLGAAPFLLSLIAVVSAALSAPRLRTPRQAGDSGIASQVRESGVPNLFGPASKSNRREIWFWAAWALVSILLTLPISSLAWRYVPIVPYAQFPWRYLMLAMIPLSILPATLVANGGWRMANGEWRMANYAEHATRNTQHATLNIQYLIPRLIWPTLLLSTLLLLGSSPYLKVEMREPTPEQGPVSYAALMRFQRTSDEMTGVTAWVDPEKRPHWSDMAELWVQGKDVTTRVDYSRVPQNRTLAVNSENVGSAHEEIYFYAQGSGQSITFNRFWYPGWTAYLLDGKGGKPVRTLPLERENGPLARIVMPVPAGEGYILLRFEDTPLRAAAKWITLATMALIAAVMLARALRLRPFVAKSVPQ